MVQCLWVARAGYVSAEVDGVKLILKRGSFDILKSWKKTMEVENNAEEKINGKIKIAIVEKKIC